MRYLTTKQVCDILQISRKKAYDLYKLKGFPCVRIGNDYRVDADEFEQFMKRYSNSTIHI